MNRTSASTVFDSPVGPLFARAEAGELVRLSFVDRPIRARTLQCADVESSDIVKRSNFKSASISPAAKRYSTCP
jgi:hypothetical protein